MCHQLRECRILRHCLLHLSIHVPTGVARGNEPLSGPPAGVESGQPKKFGAMFFKNCLPLLGGFDHFLGIVAFKARELYDRHNVVLPWFALVVCASLKSAIHQDGFGDDPKGSKKTLRALSATKLA